MLKRAEMSAAELDGSKYLNVTRFEIVLVVGLPFIIETDSTDF